MSDTFDQEERALSTDLPLAVHPDAPSVARRPVSGALEVAWLCLESMRPGQWHKNAFVLAGLMFSGQLLEPEAHARSWLAFAGFCLASGGAYLLNDVRDADADRRSPRTAGRPVARGALAPGAALGAAAVCAVSALGLAAAVNATTFAFLAAFCAVQAAYSLRLKQVVGADVAALSTGFVLRALAGAAAVGVPASLWLLACTMLLTLFLGLAKRRGELAGLGGERPQARPVLAAYAALRLDAAIALVAAGTVAVYALYCLLGPYGPAMLVTLPMVGLGVHRARTLARRSPAAAEDPSLLSVSDGRLAMYVLAWIVAAALVSELAT